VTFRGRLVLATTAAALVVVLMGSIATYLVAYHSLVGATDASLSAQAEAYIQSSDLQRIYNSCATTPGFCIQITYPNGRVDTNDGGPVIPIDDAVRTVAASQGEAPTTFQSTTIAGVDVREVAAALPPGFRYVANATPVQMVAGGALQITAPLTGVNQQLRHLALALWIIVIGGVSIAVVLGLALAHTALRPLNSLTDSVEELAETTDVSKRLDAGGPDELGRLRRAFNRLLVALDASRESQRQLVLDASHELRTPVTSLRTNMEVARRLEELDPAERDVLISDVTTQMDELVALVGDMAELARGDQPDITAEPVRFDLIVLEAVDAATTYGRSRGVTFDAAVAETWVSGSPGRIERAVDNLLDNALKWSPDGGVVEVACSHGVLIVRDHGPGVNENDVAHIFDRFYRAPSARGRPGSGLGLAIVAQVAKEEGGNVNVYRAQGGGAVFRFELPEVAAPDEDPEVGDQQ
jgi:two-component system, OmpR family, sensor histidine kinase MprB